MTLEGSRVLVTGGAGFIGSHVTEHCIAEGATVTVVDNLFAGKQPLVPDAASFHRVDIRDREALTEVIQSVKPDVIIHLAAIHYIPYCNEHPEEAFDVNVMGTRNLVDAARTVDSLERVVYTSSAAVYPPRDEPHAETDQIGPMDIYGRTKLVGEDILELFATETDVSCASARLFNVYGTHETNPHLIPAILEQLEDGSRSIELGNLTPKRDFVNVDDVASALRLLASEFDGQYRTFNVGTGTAWSVREVVEQVGAALGDTLEISQDQDRVRESDRPHLCADTGRIERELDWQPEVEFVDGLGPLVEELEPPSEEERIA